jgi:hypothetical protein
MSKENLSSLHYEHHYSHVYVLQSPGSLIIPHLNGTRFAESTHNQSNSHATGVFQSLLQSL